MKKIIVTILIIALLSTGLVFAANGNGTFAGLPIVNVKVNGETLESDVPGVVLQGRTLLPARAIAESLNAVVSWDQATKTASIIKPEVIICFVDDVNENSDGTWDLINPYGYISVGQGQNITIYYQVGPMIKQLYEYRVIVKEPNGDVLKSTSTDGFVIDSKGMQGYQTIEDLAFKKAGNYLFEFQIKYEDGFKTVGSKTLVVE